VVNRSAPGWPAGCTLVVLSGGRSRRLGRDKATTHVGGRTLIGRIVSEVPPEVPIIVVGPGVEELPGRVRVTREDPPGSGPLAAIGAGAAATSTPLVGVLATDMPGAVPVVAGALRRLSAATGSGDGATSPTGPALPAGGADAVVPVDGAGRRQPLAAAFRTESLMAALADLAPLADRPVRALLPRLRVMEWRAPAEQLADLDTAAELSAARSRATDEQGATMQDWITAVRDALALDVEVDVDTILDVARDAAHNVERPAAPITTYLLGAAVARGADPAEAATAVSRLAAQWTPQGT
jgi:molybdopterin-guanine dinucleotide biosynthesis protein A